MSSASDTNTSPTRTTPSAERRRAVLRAALSVDAGYVSRRNAAEACSALFVATLEERGLVHVTAADVPRAATALDLDDLGEVLLAWRDSRSHDAVLALPGGAVALLVSGHGACEVIVAAAGADFAAHAAEALAERFRDPPPPDDRLRVHFWAQSGPAASFERRAVEASTWEEVDGNYPRRTRAAVGALASATRPGHGSLVLWHGPPGTGKTHALRALARAWRGWASVHDVTDPERFLAGTGYLMEAPPTTRTTTRRRG